MDVINFIGTTISISSYEFDFNGFARLKSHLKQLQISVEEYFYLEDYKSFLDSTIKKPACIHNGVLLDDYGWIEVRKPKRKAKKYKFLEMFNYQIFPVFPTNYSITRAIKNSDSTSCIIYTIEKGKGCGLKYLFNESVTNLFDIELEINEIAGFKICEGINTKLEYNLKHTETLSSGFEVYIIEF